MRPSRLALVLPFAFLIAGCGGGDKSTKPVTPADGLPAGTPAANSPMNLMQRFEATWKSQVESQYAPLLSDDFRYVFSVAADPVLANQYPNWSKADEEASTRHLFDGFRNSVGDSVPGASRIDFTLTGMSQGIDFSHPDSTTQYQRVIVTAVDMTIDVPQAGADPIQYLVNARDEFYLVRGDAAVISGSANADTTHWYIRRWDDLTTVTSIGKLPVINPSRTTSLGSIKARYR
jgi:hypothetical protein